MNKRYLYYEGGLGDCIIQHMSNRAYAKYDRERNPRLDYLRVILNTHNPQAAELFRYDPRIHEIVVLPYMPHIKPHLQASLESEGFTEIKDEFDPLDANRCCYNKIQIGNPDLTYWRDAVFDHVYNRRGAIVCQLGAGKPNFALNMFFDVDHLAAAAKEFDHLVILVGGLSVRCENNCHHIVTEHPITEHPNVLDLRGVYNPRLVCNLLTSGKRLFLGSFSCYVWAAILQHVPSIAIIPAGHNDPHTQMAQVLGIKLVEMSKLDWKQPKTYIDLFHQLYFSDVA